MGHGGLVNFPATCNAVRRLGGALLCLGAAQCTTVAAFEGPQPDADTHSICYTRLASSAAEVQTLARQICTGGEPKLTKQGVDLSVCPLLVPVRVSFSCPAS